MLQTIAQILRDEHQSWAIAALNHPFVQGIGDGTLAQHKFAYYVGQDAFFLEAFARAYSVAAAKAPDWEAFVIFHDLADGVLQELRLHQGYAAQWNVNLQNVKPDVATRRYTDFLMAIAWGKEIGITAAAMLPCMKLYAFLGQELAKKGIPDHVYSDWIRTYTSGEFEALVEQLEKLVNQYAVLNQEIQSTYAYAMQCEVDFFQGAWAIG
ncbi:TenA family protein [Calothrix sp. PCC 7507]|uniref:TenA family protein n=1 Tax=Calothrix sp. PCC 7507 TaxID=99598 RepID=UPI00029F2113|nr:TenA family protein [Calothrix sp. PCC 7507]AFY33710.1 thiaminase [Calothrix sp. PCC 7507]